MLRAGCLLLQSKANDASPPISWVSVNSLWCFLVCMCVLCLPIAARYHKWPNIDLTNYELKSQFLAQFWFQFYCGNFPTVFVCLLVYNIRTHSTNHSSVRVAKNFAAQSLVSFYVTAQLCWYEHGGKFSTLITILYCQFGLN